MAEIVFHHDRWPLVVVEFPASCNDEEFRAYLTTLTRNLSRKEQVVYVMDSRQSLSTPPRHRKWQAQWMADHEEELRLYSLGTAFVMSSPVTRFILASIFLIKPIPTPYKVVRTLEQAERWAQEQLDKARLERGAV